MAEFVCHNRPQLRHIERLQTNRRFLGGDLNAESLRFSMARILAEVVPAMRPNVEQLALFNPAAGASA